MSPTTTARLRSIGACESAEAIRSKQASSREMVEAHLQRNPVTTMQSFITRHSPGESQPAVEGKEAP